MLENNFSLLKNKVSELEKALSVSVDVTMLKASEDERCEYVENLIRSLDKANQKNILYKIDRIVHNLPTVVLNTIGGKEIYRIHDIPQAAAWLTKYLGYPVLVADVTDAIENQTEFGGFEIYYEYEE